MFRRYTAAVNPSAKLQDTNISAQYTALLEGASDVSDAEISFENLQTFIQYMALIEKFLTF
jgi:hypothetical protein